MKKNMLDAGRAPRSVEYALAVIRQVFNYARDHEFFTGQIPVNKVKIPRADNRRIRFLTHDESEELLAELAERSPDLHDMALLALHCGPRAGEIFGLSWKDVDFDRGLVTLRHTKNGQVRHVPMTDRVREMLKNRELVRDQDNDLVFPSRNGDRIKKVSHAFERAVKDLGWNKGLDDSRQKVVFHSLRHTCASWLVMAGVPLYTVKEYLGHRQISQTERYAHLAPDSLQQATAALNGMGKKQEEDQGKVVNLW
jgi:integrase